MKLDQHARRAIRQFYKGVCQYCGVVNAKHIDHIVAKSKGGTDALSNLILACSSCNTRKGNGDVAPQFLGLLTAIAQKNEERIRKLIGEISGNLVWGYRVGISKENSTFVRFDRKNPTREQLHEFCRVSEYYAALKSRMDAAKSENRTR